VSPAAPDEVDATGRAKIDVGQLDQEAGVGRTGHPGKRRGDIRASAQLDRLDLLGVPIDINLLEGTVIRHQHPAERDDSAGSVLDNVEAARGQLNLLELATGEVARGGGEGDSHSRQRA
jgi:hypothetical protein